MNKKELPKDYKPSIKDADWFINYWKEEPRFSAPAGAMFKVCKDYPNNNNLEEVLIKSAVIDNFSSTNVFDLHSVARHIVQLKFDERIKSYDPLLVRDISEVEIGGKKHRFYSFATKYCHYHNPDDYPIYDSYVAKVLCHFYKNIKEEQLRKYETFKNTLQTFRSDYSLETLSTERLDNFLWQLGRWYLNPYEPTPKYYHREEESPFATDDIRYKFWYGEMMFVTTHQKSGLWEIEGKEWLKTANEDIKKLADKFGPDQFGMITYIAFQYSKWYPYDDPIWILNY